MPKISPVGFIRKRKLQIEQDLRKNPNDPRYSYFTPKKSKSAIWGNYRVLKFNEQIEPYAQCKGCRELLSYSSKSGTGSLLRHKCRTKNRNNSFPKHIIGEDDDEHDERTECSTTNGDETLMTLRALEDFKASPTLRNSSICSPLSGGHDNDTNGEEHANFENCDVTSNTLANSNSNMRDKYDAFGDNVANEMRQLLDVPDIQFQLKSAILKSILEANTQAHEIRRRRKRVA